MSDYIKVDVISSGEVSKYLGDGWEIIETAKTSYDGIETTVNYHIGLPAKVVLVELISIIKDYEEQGFKDKLFEGVAEKYKETLSDYKVGSGYPTSSKTARYMEKYESLVNNNPIKVFNTHSENKSGIEF